MVLLFAIILGLVQGLTEFIPVSSAAHLIVFDELFGLAIGSLAFDVFLHLGTLMALLIYFRRDLIAFIKAILDESVSARLPIHILIATLPAVVIGFFAYNLVATAFRSLWVVVIMLLLLALVMFVADKRQGKRDLSQMTLNDALIIGSAQALALIPGTSRSGATIVAGSLLKFNNGEAARFSFYMAIPVLLGANVRVLAEPGVMNQALTQWPLYLVGLTVSFLSGYLMIAWLLKFLSTHKLAVFAWYRIALALVIAVVLVM